MGRLLSSLPSLDTRYFRPRTSAGSMRSSRPSRSTPVRSSAPRTKVANLRHYSGSFELPPLQEDQETQEARDRPSGAGGAGKTYRTSLNHLLTSLSAAGPYIPASPPHIRDIGESILSISQHPVSLNGHFCDLYEGVHAVAGKVALKRPRIVVSGANQDTIRVRSHHER